MVNHPTRSRTDGAKITKHKAEGGGWQIYVGGKPTNLFITKSEYPPRWREPQEYDLCEGGDHLLMTAPGVSILMARLELLRDLLGA